MNLQPGESKQVTVNVDPKNLSVFDEKQNKWVLVPGTYTFMAGSSSADLPLHQTANVQ
jgi:beta-glucosidase